MTYTVLDQFKNLFYSASETYYVDGNLCVGMPMSSDYSEHLLGKGRLEVPTERTRFSLAEIDGNCYPPSDSPLVAFKRGHTPYVCLFLRETYADTFVQLKRVADYYNIKLKKPECYTLPFFGATLGFAPLDDDGKEFKYVEDALQYCSKKITSIKAIDLWERELPYSDAPFCVQSYFLVNNKLPDFADVYLDAKGLPIEDKEKAEWWKKNTAPLNCDCAWCNKDRCVGRKYGITSNEISQLSFGELVQYTEEPVVYKWAVNGSTMRFDNEVDIIHQDRFLRLCMRSLGTLPRKLKGNTWLRIINKALSNMRVIGKEDSSKLTIDNLNKIIIEDLKDRVLVSSYFEYERLMQSYMYLEPASSCIVIHPSSLCSYLTGKYSNLRINTLTEFCAVLRHLGFKSRSYKVDGNHINLMACRSRFLFKNESDWEKYLLDVSKDTMWESNFRAFLLNEDTDQEDISEKEKNEIISDAVIFLDTEVKNGYS